MKIVDAHVHIWEDRSHYQKPVAPEGVRSDVDWLVEQQEACGVAQAVVVQGSADPYEYEYMRASARRYPGRFALVGLVDPRDAGAADYVRACPDRGISGVRVPLTGRSDQEIGDPRADALWEAATAAGVALCLYTRAHQAGAVRRLIERFPTAQVVIDHMGLPLRDGQPDPRLIEDVVTLAALPGVAVKLSAFPVLSREPYPHADALDMARRLIAAFGPERLMWGTDFPYIQQQCGYAAGLQLLTERMPELSPVDRVRILGDTARSIFRFV